jgi:hypothetical protein
LALCTISGVIFFYLGDLQNKNLRQIIGVHFPECNNDIRIFLQVSKVGHFLKEAEKLGG